MRGIILITLLLLESMSLIGQSIANYVNTRTTSITYNSISSSGSPFGSWRNTGTYSQDDNRSEFTDIGFDFWYNGTRYTQFSVSTNGFIDFSTSTANGTGTGAYGYSNAAFTGNGSGTWLAIAPFYDDLTAQGGTDALGNSIKYLVSGTAPNRVLTVEWINMAVYGNTTPNLNYQVKLYETTGVIEFVYGTMTNGTNTFSYSDGINAATLSNTPTAAQLKMQRTANTNTFNNTETNNLVTIPASNSQIAFTPPTPTVPSGSLTFSAVTQTAMTLNWTNWAANEIGYVIYNSTDGTNYSFVSQTAVNATSSTVTGLLPGTLYYWKLYAVTEGNLGTNLSGSQATNAAGNKISTGSGSWNTAGTWSPAGVPTAADNVTITGTHTVTINTNAVCNNLIVGQGSAAVLLIGDNTTARTITVNNDVTINTFATFMTNGASNATHAMTIKGNVTNDWTFNMAIDANSLCNTTFNKSGDQLMSGGGTSTFNLVTMNLASASNTLEISTASCSAPTNFLTLTKGIFKVSTSGISNLTPFSGATTIGSNSSVWLNSSVSSMTFGAAVTLNGSIRVTAGTMNIGDAADEDLISDGGDFTIDGGTVNIAGKYYTTNINNLARFTINSGTLTVPNVGSTNTTIAPFQISGVGSEFNMSGGTIIIPREGGTGAQNLGFVNTGASSGSVTGGVLQIGSVSSPVAQIIQINSAYPVGGLTVNSANATAQLLTNNLTIYDDVLLTSGTLNSNNLNITSGGDWTNDLGTFTPGTGTVTFNGAGPQVINGIALSQTFNNVIVAKTVGTILSTGGSTTTVTTNNFTLTSGNFTAPAILNVNAAASSALTLTNGTLTAGTIINITGNWTNNGGTFDGGIGTVNFTGAGAQAINGTAVSQTFNNIVLLKTAGTTLSSGGSTTTITANNYTQTSGDFTAPATLNINTQSTSSILLTAGTLTAGTNINLTGNWTNNGATFTPGSGTVTFDGSGVQTILKTGGETFNNIVFNNTGAKLLSSPITTNADFTINTGSNLDVSASNHLVTIKGNFSNSGTFNTRNGNVFLNGTTAQTINGTSITSFYDLTLDNNSGASLTSEQNIINSLVLNNGTFNINSQNFTLVSTATGTGRIAAITGTGDITGNVIIQRFAPGGTTGWAYLGTPVTSAITLTQWDDDIPISCATCPDGSAGGFISIYRYDETAGGAFDDGAAYIPMSNINDPILAGTGYWVYLGDGFTTTNDITIDVTGTVRKFNYTQPLSYTNTGSSVDDGWNLITNPYPSPISWTAFKGATSNIDNAIYVYNADLNGGVGAHAAYVNGISSPAVGSGGIGNVIPIGQGFYVHSTGATSLSGTETIKIGGNPTFLRENGVNNITSNNSLLRLKINGLGYRDESVLYTQSGATNNFDLNYDAYKLVGNDPYAATISLFANQTKFQINAVDEIVSNFSMDVKTLTGYTGNYTISTEGISSLPQGSCINLYDKFTGITTDLRSSNYTFNLRDTTTVARFVLNITSDPLNITSTVNQQSCVAASGSIIAEGNSVGPWNYYWKDATGNIIKTSLNKASADTLSNLTDGTYTLEVNTVGTCDNSTTVFTIDPINNTPLQIVSSQSNPDCSNPNSGMLTALGNNSGPWDFVWKDDLGNVIQSTFNSFVADTLSALASGGYTLEINTTGSCDINTQIFTLNTNYASPVQITSSLQQPDCTDPTAGSITAIGNNSGPWDYVWKDESGNVLQTNLASGTSETLSNINGGNYTLEINTSGVCDLNSINFSLNSPIIDPIDIIATTSLPTCEEPNSAFLTATGSGIGPWNYTWTDSIGNIVLNTTNSMASDTLSGLTEGTYFVEVNTVGLCDYNTFEYLVKPANPYPLQILATQNPPTCDLPNSGEIIVVGENSGPWNYIWKDINGNIIQSSTNDSLPSTLSNLSGGTFTLEINSLTEACDNNTFTFVVNPVIYPTASFNSVDTVDLALSGNINFNDQSVNAQNYLWDFGYMGLTSTSASPSTSYDTAGVYNILLIVESATGCVDTLSKDIYVINSTTGLGLISGVNGILIKTVSPTQYHISNRNNTEYNIVLVDAQGRVLKQFGTLKSKGESLQVEIENYQSGMYYLQLLSPEGNKVIKLIRN